MSGPLRRVANAAGRGVGTVERHLRSARLGLVVGTLAAVSALVVVFSPVLPGPLLALGTALDNPGAIAAVAFVVAVVALWAAYRSTDGAAAEPVFESPPETPDADDQAVTGWGVDQSFESLTDVDERLNSHEYEHKRRRVVLKLRGAAIDVVSGTADISPQKATERIDDGTWTDDERARALLGDEDVRLSLSTRIEDWLSGEGFERNVDATLAELRRLAGVDEATTTPVSSGFEDGLDAPEVDGDRTHSQTETITSADTETTRRSRWDIGVVVAFLLAGVGFVQTNTALVLGAVVALTYAVYGYATRPPAATLSVTRAVSDTAPAPGQSVAVRLTVENVGEHPIPEVSVADGVPEALVLTEGTARASDTLRPGESLTVSYAVQALRGDHDFGPTRVWTRNVSGEIARETTVSLPAALSCRDPVEDVALGGETTPYTGRIPTDSGGPGVEFFATREYQASDPLKQIDWNFWARTGEPRTIEFRKHRAAAVVFLLDDRREARQARHEWSPDALTLGRHAALRMADALLADANAVGGALLSARRYELPDRGRRQPQRLRSLFALDGDGEEARETDSATGVTPSESSPSDTPDVNFGMMYSADGGTATRWLCKRLPADAQVVFVTPLLDDPPTSVARRLDAEGYDCTVLSPDVTRTETPGSCLEHIERRERLRTLRGRGLQVADWPTERPLSVALERAHREWSR